jgi:hypothetical protein
MEPPPSYPCLYACACIIYQSSSSFGFDIAIFLARSASASIDGVLLLLPSDPFPFILIPESRVCKVVGFLAAAGRLAGGAGLFRPAPFIPGGGGGARGISVGAGACSST